VVLDVADAPRDEDGGATLRHRNGRGEVREAVVRGGPGGRRVAHDQVGVTR
jgi:hypothetical protein